MNATEKRQANRIIRNAKRVERIVFDLIAFLQDGTLETCLEFDWDLCLTDVKRIQHQTAIVHDLVENTIRKLAEPMED